MASAKNAEFVRKSAPAGGRVVAESAPPRLPRGRVRWTLAGVTSRLGGFVSDCRASNWESLASSGLDEAIIECHNLQRRRLPLRCDHRGRELQGIATSTIEPE